VVLVELQRLDLLALLRAVELELERAGERKHRADREAAAELQAADEAVLVDAQQARRRERADEERRGRVDLQLELRGADLEVEVAVEGDEIEQLHAALDHEHEVAARRIEAAVAA